MSENISPLNGKTVILGVTAGIAVYKGADLCSKLTSAGAVVHVVMTPNAEKLISPKLFFTLSRNPVTTNLWEVTGDWVPEHVKLANTADLLIVAPATANFLGKFANGIADDALTTTALAYEGTGKKILIAPAMNSAMWASPAVVKNCALLAERKIQFAGPAQGNLACGTAGQGRMVEVPEILQAAEELLQN